MSERDLAGRNIVVTGSNTGIGRVTALELARRGAAVTLACRTEAKAAPVIDEIKRETGNDNVDFLPLDLSSLERVRSSARALLDRDAPLHVLINNAGLAGQRGETADGFELTFGVNHVGTFLFTTLLLDKLRDSAPARIVTVASKAHYKAKGIDFDAVRGKTRSVTGYSEYKVSKLANVLFSAELARKLDGTGVTTYSLHPGVVGSDVWRNVPWPVRPLMKSFMITTEEGAKTSIYCAASHDVAEHTGRYYDSCAERTPSRAARDEKLAAELWARSEEWVG